MNLLPFFEDDLNSHASRKRLAAAAKRRVGVYNQAGEPTTFQKKSRRERYIVRDDVVPLTGLEPVRCCQRGIFSPHHVAIAARKALWSGLSLHPRRILRCAPSSLYTFPEWSGLRSALSRTDGSFTEFDAIHTDGFPVRCSNFKSLVSADFTTAA